MPSSEDAFERSRRRVSLVLSKAAFPIVATVGGITSAPSSMVSEKALFPISTSEVAFDRSRPRELGIPEGL